MSIDHISLSIAVAHSRNRVIGHDGGMPWTQREDLRRFRAMTLAKPVIMGRKTYETLGKPLSGRTNIVVSRQPSLDATNGVIFCNSLSQGIDNAREIALVDNVSEAFIIGGGDIYRQALDLVDYIYTTELDTEIIGDTYFPEIPNDFTPIVISPTYHSDVHNSFDFRYVTYHRRDKYSVNKG